MIKVITNILGTMLLVVSALPGAAAVIIDQPVTGITSITSQAFPDFSASTSQAFDDFSLLQSYNIGKLTVYGEERGNSALNVSVVGQIWNGLPGSGGSVKLTSLGAEVGDDLIFDFGGQLLPAGDYWVSAFVTRSFTNGGQWFWFAHNPVSGSEAKWINPGGGFGQGTTVIDAADAISSSVPFDMAFKLEGTAAGTVPEPGSLTLVGLALFGVFAAARVKRSA